MRLRRSRSPHPVLRQVPHRHNRLRRARATRFANGGDRRARRRHGSRRAGQADSLRRLRNGDDVGAARPLDRAGTRNRPCLRRYRDHIARCDAGAICAASRWRWRRMKPATSRAAIAPADGLSRRCRGEIVQLGEAEVLARLKPLLEDASVLKIAQNLKYDFLMFLQRGIRVTPFDDTMLMSYVLEARPARPRHGRIVGTASRPQPISFSEVAGKGKDKITFDCVPVARSHALFRRRCRRHFAPARAAQAAAGAEGKRRSMRPWSGRLLPVLADMERAGITIDPDLPAPPVQRFRQMPWRRWKPKSTSWRASSFNIGSPKQLGDILFEQFKLAGGRKTKTGAWSTDADVLEDLAAQGHEIAKKVLDWRQLRSCAAPIPTRCPATSIPRPDACTPPTPWRRPRPAGSPPPIPICRTFRSAPKRADAFAQAFIAAKGMKLISADYSQIELRLLAHIADIPAAEKGVRRRPRHPCHDGLGDFRRAGKGHAGGNPPPSQGDQFRHRLRHFRFRSCQPAGHRAQRSRRLHQEIFSALPRHPRLHGTHQGVCPRTRLCRNAVRPAHPYPRDQGDEFRACAAAPNAPPSMRRSRALPPTSSAAP